MKKIITLSFPYKFISTLKSMVNFLHLFVKMKKKKEGTNLAENIRLTIEIMFSVFWTFFYSYMKYLIPSGYKKYCHTPLFSNKMLFN